MTAGTDDQAYTHCIIRCKVQPVQTGISDNMDATVSGIQLEVVESGQDSATIRTRFDQEETPASMAIVATLANVTDTDPTDLRPLYAAVDPDAVNALVSARPRAHGDTYITFTHEGHEIQVASSGVVTITRTDHAPEEAPREKGA